ncbi:putative protein-disulfide isomerase [Nitrosomonas cryotolerans]|uniref:DSBA-like thioredoxin domain-containing protein n=1 Tax=Nitrosomonas cryotolerans ATCC 49181 TaxID=1131553 RepID=A0A1N6IBH6_9PROT|nr:DsbA family protein [Nitrosomonas cryotolerans]SFP61468.1 putative protein-disulfide isomerase [Nitrosomonas cryotolerans]SIO29364.1 putative protein-disulfide isomerase [Nitrosomonas cryotolerans ATCC 49181]
MSDTRLFYIYDPMCSWCYAFNTSWAALRKDLPASIRVIGLLGGLAPDTKEPMPVSMRDMIQQVWRRIEESIPNAEFNHDFWRLNTPFRSTYPACRAILVARKQDMALESKMLQAIQTAYYQNAKNPSLLTILQECATEVGLDANKFIKDLTDPIIDCELQREIKYARSMNVFSYPSLRLVHNETQFPITVDYLNHHSMIDEIMHIQSSFPT